MSPHKLPTHVSSIRQRSPLHADLSPHMSPVWKHYNAYSCHCKRDASCHMTCSSNWDYAAAACVLLRTTRLLSAIIHISWLLNYLITVTQTTNPNRNPNFPDLINFSIFHMNLMKIQLSESSCKANRETGTDKRLRSKRYVPAPAGTGTGTVVRGGNEMTNCAGCAASGSVSCRQAILQLVTRTTTAAPLARRSLASDDYLRPSHRLSLWHLLQQNRGFVMDSSS